MALPTIVIYAALARSLLWLTLLIPAVRSVGRRPLVLVLVALGLVANAVLLAGSLEAQGLIGIASTALLVWVLLTHLRSEPTALQALLGEKEARWSRQRHNLMEAAGMVIQVNGMLRARAAAAGVDMSDLPDATELLREAMEGVRPSP